MKIAGLCPVVGHTAPSVSLLWWRLGCADRFSRDVPDGDSPLSHSESRETCDWTERSARLCEACSQHAIAVYTRFRSRGSVAMRTSSRRRPKPVSPSKPANPSKPHKPVLSRSARGSTTRVSGGRVSGGGTGVWANVGGPGQSKLVASIPIAIHVEHWVFFIEPPFLSTLLREPTLLMIINVKVHSLQELYLCLTKALVQGQRAGGIAGRLVMVIAMSIGFEELAPGRRRGAPARPR